MLFSDGIFTCLHLLWPFPKLKQLQGVESERCWAFLTPIHQPACFSCNVAFTTVWLFMLFFLHFTSLHFATFNSFHFIIEFHIFFPHIRFSFNIFVSVVTPCLKWFACVLHGWKARWCCWVAFILELFAMMFIPVCLVSFPLLEILSVPPAALCNANSLGLFI